MNLPEKQIKFTAPQLLAALSHQKRLSLEWGRGGGKSTIIGWRVKEIARLMPRSKSGIVGSTYQQLLTRTLPSTIEGLELLGYKKDVHYFVGRRPPKEWRWQEAYQPPLSYDNYISFYNGTGYELISLNNSDSGRGLNLDAVLGDEAALFNKEKLDNNVLLSNRGNIHRFAHTDLHHSEMFSSTTPVSSTGRWFIQREELAKAHPNEYCHIIAESQYNIDNLGWEYFRMLQRTLTPLVYNAEVKCIRPGRAQTGFYPSFNEEYHTLQVSNDKYVLDANYDLEKLRGAIPDGDVIRTLPIDIACDYGARINTIVCGQEHTSMYRLVNALFVKSPQTIMDLAQAFCDYYHWQICKEVNYYYDHTAEYRDAARTTTFADEFTQVLVKNGWRVNRVYVGQAPLHATKYLFLNIVFKEEHAHTPKIRMNRDRCKYLIVSILNAGAKEGRTGIEKDKRPERKEDAVDEETTHFSDAFDTLIHSKFKDRMQQHDPMTYISTMV